VEDDFLTALQHAIKEEIVENYFHERRVIEEEKAEVDELLAGQAQAAEKVNQAKASLEALLVEPGFAAKLWESAGRSSGAKLEKDEPHYPAWTWPLRALSWRVCYRNRVCCAAGEVWSVQQQYEEALAELDSLIQEVNADIDRFQANFDFLLLSSVINQLDQETLAKKHFLGSALEGNDRLSLDERLRLPKIKVRVEELRVLPPLPPARCFQEAAGQVAREVLKAHPRLARGLVES